MYHDQGVDPDQDHRFLGRRSDRRPALVHLAQDHGTAADIAGGGADAGLLAARPGARRAGTRVRARVEVTDSVAELPPLRETITAAEQTPASLRQPPARPQLPPHRPRRRVAGRGHDHRGRPGSRAASQGLLLEGAAKVVAIEVDPRHRALNPGACRGQPAEVIERCAADRPPRWVRSTPDRRQPAYNISTALLIRAGCCPRWASADMDLRVPEGVVTTTSPPGPGPGLWTPVGADQHVCEVRRLFDACRLRPSCRHQGCSSVAQLTPRPAA